VEEAIMIEPTETESKETLDSFIQVMKKSQKMQWKNLIVFAILLLLHLSERLDEVTAARKPVLRWGA
jgi:glycine dehydrogenase subunit 2